MNNVRQQALGIIHKVLNDGAYSNLLLNDTIKDSNFNTKDIGLLTELVYGTIQYKLTLDFYLENYIKGKKINNYIRNLLWMSVYQIVYLDRIPSHAIINEAVNIAKEKNVAHASFVNAVLRNFLRNPVRELTEIENKVERLSIETSHPLWLVKMWVKQYDFTTAKNICLLNNMKPYQFARMNLVKDSKENILNQIKELGLDYEESGVIDEGILLKRENIANTAIYKKGYVNVQDLSSMIVSKILDAKENERILDACAAPGGKSTHTAEIMKDNGEVIACDIHDHKIKLIQNHANRLGLKSIRPMLIDATNLTNFFELESFDRVLVDAPCSGFGVIRRKPEIKYNKKPSDLDEITVIQKQIIDEAVKLVKDQGTLVYSTCTISKKENEKMVEYILDTYPEFKLDKEPFVKLKLESTGTIQMIDQVKGADIFFISCFKKNK